MSVEHHDYVNGAKASLVAFLEEIYVTPAHRQRNITRCMVDVATEWAITRCSSKKLVSNAVLDNETSHQMHCALGFAETEHIGVLS